MELGSVEAIKKLVGAGMGCAVLPRLALAERGGDRLVSRPLSPRLHRMLALVLRRDKQLDRSLRAFVKTLAAVA